MIEKVKRLFGIPRKNDSNNALLVSCEKLESRVALIEEGRLEEYNVERDSDRNIVGSIYKGIVRNIEPGLKAMFVDIGFEKNAFLHFWDAIPAALDSGVEEVRRTDGTDPKKKKKDRRITAKDIPDIYPVGSEVIVQVSKGPISNKGPRITTNLSLPGRYLVLLPYSAQCGISRKIDNQEERQRLRKILNELDIPEGMGVIMRTVGEGQRARYFVRDLSLLLEQWEDIENGKETKKAPATLFSEPGLVERSVRDFLTDDISIVHVDDLEACERMQDLVGQISKRARRRVQFYNEPQPMFERFGIQEQIDEAFRRQVWLPCGGYIVIDETEAMITIDVNTGRNKGSRDNKDMDKTLLTTNLEAADEIARQLRLRNIGGLIVADFIDMKQRRDQQAVFQRMKDRLKRDKARTQVLPISSLGLMEMTRQRAHESLHDAQFMPCPNCGGRGFVKTPMTLSVELQRSLHSVIRKHLDATHEFKVVVHPVLLQRLRSEDEELLIDIERRYECRLTFRSDPSLNLEKFNIFDALTNKEFTP